MGLTEDLVNQLFTEIHDANMTKAKGVKAGREGFKAADASKPANWIDPKERLKEVLHGHINNP